MLRYKLILKKLCKWVALYGLAALLGIAVAVVVLVIYSFVSI